MSEVYVVRYIDIEISDIIGIYTSVDAAKDRALTYQGRYEPAPVERVWHDGDNGWIDVTTVDAYPLDTAVSGEWDGGYRMIGYAR